MREDAVHASPSSAPEQSTALFITCFNDSLFPEAGRATVQLLERLGVRLQFPEEQTCCGQMHFNTGYRKEAAVLARRFVEIFEPFETVVCPSASCAGMVRESYKELAEDSRDRAFGEAVEILIPRVFELSEYLVRKLGVTDLGAYYPHRVTYHPTCHSLRVLDMADLPLQLLREVRGIELVELPQARECCGFGGTFAIKNADTSMAMLADKVRHVRETAAEVCVSADTSCLMQIGGALRRQRSGVRTVHFAEILAQTEP
jgi:L-lactate dehydrogenase complex protein LldE